MVLRINHIIAYRLPINQPAADRKRKQRTPATWRGLPCLELPNSSCSPQGVQYMYIICIQSSCIAYTMHIVYIAYFTKYYIISYPCIYAEIFFVLQICTCICICPRLRQGPSAMKGKKRRRAKRT